MLRRLKENSGPKSSWQEAKSFLGHGQGNNLPKCTTNDNPSETAQHENEFFVKKNSRLVSSLKSQNLVSYTAVVHE